MWIYCLHTIHISVYGYFQQFIIYMIRYLFVCILVICVSTYTRGIFVCMFKKRNVDSLFKDVCNAYVSMYMCMYVCMYAQYLCAVYMNVSMYPRCECMLVHKYRYIECIFYLYICNVYIDSCFRKFMDLYICMD